jgi:hypothetical protein
MLGSGKTTERMIRISEQDMNMSSISLTSVRVSNDRRLLRLQAPTHALQPVFDHIETLNVENGLRFFNVSKTVAGGKLKVCH